MRLFFILCLVLSNFFSIAQQSVEQLRETAIMFQKQEDFTNTLMILGKALDMEPQNLTILKDVALTYYLAGDFKRAEARILPLTDRVDADVQVFQIAGNIFKASEDSKTCDKLYKKGLKKFPKSGALYSEYGDLKWSLEKPEEAIQQWEAGINAEPSHSGNYYHAAKFYFAAADKVRSIMYGEIFTNLESYSVRTSEIKILLIESYKRVFVSSESKQYYIKKTTEFEVKFLETLMKQSELASRGITPETLLIIRAKFMLDWCTSNSNAFPHQLFDHLQYLMRDGMFEAYNQWLFGPASDVNAYQNWLKIHANEFQRFQLYQRNKLFRMPEGQHYL
jgi:Tfp pilus assembly protein PilF